MEFFRLCNVWKGKCTRTNKHNAYIYRATNVACYSSHQLQFDVSCKDFESGDTCKVYYKYDSGLKQILETFASAEDAKRWPDTNDPTTHPTRYHTRDPSTHPTKEPLSIDPT
eukprot:743622_1